MLSVRRAAVAAQKRAAFSSPMQAAGLADLKDKERGAEQVFFNKEDEKALRKLLQKMKGQADANDKEGLKDHIQHDKEGLKNIVGLDLTDEQVKALLKWKHHQ